ncbi:cytochrome C biosynthesis protein, partial [Desulfosarcina sp.]|nr:cytochrome C biosynthesis protein [Desulfosarcina sp.]
MITSLFETLSNALNSTPLIAFGASFVWGILSILLSPCHLASIPLIVGFVDKQGVTSARRAFILSALFSMGILVTITVIGVITGMMGRMLGDIGSWGNYFVAV